MAKGTFGERLKRERELREVPLSDIAKATRISERYLGALENEDWDKLPGGVFGHGFVRSIARYLGLDEEALLAEYDLARGDQAPPPPLPTEQTGIPRPPLWPFVAAGSLLLTVLLAGGIYGWHLFSSHRAKRAPAPQPPAPQSTVVSAAPAVTTPPPAARSSPSPAASSSSNSSTASKSPTLPSTTSSSTDSPSPESTASLTRSTAPTLPPTPSTSSTSSTSPRPTASSVRSAPSTLPSTNSTSPAASPSLKSSASLTRSAPPTSSRLQLSVSVTARTRVRVIADRFVQMDRHLRPGESRHFKAKDHFEVTADDPGVVLLELNGRVIPPPDAHGASGRIILSRKHLEQAPGGNAKP